MSSPQSITENTLFYGDNLPIRREGIQAYLYKKLKAK
jgi:hypothetical protein